MQAARVHTETLRFRSGMPLALKKGDRSGPILAGTLYLPADAHPEQPPRAAVIVGHGAGSRRVRHDSFCRTACRRGLIVLSFDFRGHGESDGELNGPAHEDILAGVALLRSHPLVDGNRICYRGSSMGGYYGLQAARDYGFAALALVCPASEEVLRSGIARADDPDEIASLEDRGLELRLDAEGMRQFLDRRPSLDIAPLVSCPVLLLHARGDDVVPLGHTLALALALSGPVDVKVVDEGNHSSIQASPHMHEFTVRWLLEQAPGSPPPADEGREQDGDPA